LPRLGSRVRISFPAPEFGNPGYSGVFIFWKSEFSIIVTLAEWQSGYAAVCKTVYLGSIPGSASKFFIQYIRVCPGGGIGRRKGLKIPRPCGRAGSIPAPGTILNVSILFFYIWVFPAIFSN
jgi:hypothetical protein